MSMASGQPPIRIRDLRFRYPGADHDVLRIPSLDVRELGLTALTGPSGAGKSTLVELLAGTLREPYDGTVEVLGEDWRAIGRDSDRQRHLRRVGLITQDYGFVSGRSVREALEQDLADAQVPRELHSAKIEAALREVGLATFADREVNRLSGGQRQRVAIAKMLAREVDLVIADEPTANLDPDLVDEVMTLLRHLGEDVPVIVVTHDSHVASLCDRTILMQANAPYAPTEPRTDSARNAGRPGRLAAAVIAVVLGAGGVALVLSRAGGLGGLGGVKGANTTATPSPAVTLVTPIMSSDVITTPPPTVNPVLHPVCRAGQVQIAIANHTNRSMHELVTFEIRNSSPATCDLMGFPGVSVIDGSNRVFGRETRETASVFVGNHPAPYRIELPSGAPTIPPEDASYPPKKVHGHAYFNLEYGACTGGVSSADRWRIYIPDERVSVLVPDQQAASANCGFYVTPVWDRPAPDVGAG